MIALICRCCGAGVAPLTDHPIHTKCIPKHWDKHARGQFASRCREFGPGPKPKCEASASNGSIRCNRYAPNTITIEHGQLIPGAHGAGRVDEYERLTLCDDHARAIFREAGRLAGDVIACELAGPASANRRQWINR